MAIEFGDLGKSLERDTSRPMWFLVLLCALIALWWFSTQHALTRAGLVSDVFLEKAEALTGVETYAQKIRDFPGRPVITAQTYLDGNTEARLVVRTMSGKAVVYALVAPFVIPALIGFLFGGWCFAVALHFLPNVRKTLKSAAFRLVFGATLVAAIYHVGLVEVYKFFRG